MNALTHLFCSKVRAEIVGLLFGLSDKPLHLREIQRKAHLAVGTIQRDVAHLVSMGLVLRRADGNRVYFSANPAHPLTSDLRRLVLKTTGLVDILRLALGKAGIQFAFVFGSIAAGTEQPWSDVDLLIVGDLGLREVSKRLSGVGEQIGREINPQVMTAVEFAKRRREQEHFIATVMASPRIWVMGAEDELEAMVG